MLIQPNSKTIQNPFSEPYNYFLFNLENSCQEKHQQFSEKPIQQIFQDMGIFISL